MRMQVSGTIIISRYASGTQTASKGISGFAKRIQNTPFPEWDPHRSAFVMSRLYVWVQFICLSYLLFIPPVRAQGVWLAVELAGLAMGLHAVWIMRWSRWQVFPEVREGACLIQHGIYRRIRHPMYLALLLVTGSVTATLPSPDRLLVFAALCVVLHLKMNIEEHVLQQHFPEYAAYRKATRRLIPFLY
jgi:protein-S-isoprenylcysteine O-methyltransferase Ste14